MRFKAICPLCKRDVYFQNPEVVRIISPEILLERRIAKLERLHMAAKAISPYIDTGFSALGSALEKEFDDAMADLESHHSKILTLEDECSAETLKE